MGFAGNASIICCCCCCACDCACCCWSNPGLFGSGGGAGCDAQAAAAAILNDAAATALGCVAAARFGMKPRVNDEEEALAPPWKLPLPVIEEERPFARASTPLPATEALKEAPLLLPRPPKEDGAFVLLSLR